MTNKIKKKERWAEYMSNYYKSHKSQMALNRKRSYEKHRDSILIHMKEYRDTHKETISTYHKNWLNKHSDYAKKYYISHKDTYKNKYLKSEKFKKYQKEYRLAHKDKCSAYRKKYYQLYGDKWNKLKKIRRKTDEKYHLDGIISCLINQSLRGKKLHRHWEDLVGYTIEDLMKRLESLFDDKMSWDNYGSYWDVDHIKPKSLFHYTCPEDKEFKECWALSNLQPLEHITNIKKYNHYE